MHAPDPIRAAALLTSIFAALLLAPASALATVDAPRPYVYITPFFQPKAATNPSLSITSGDDAAQPINVRRYGATGSLLSSTTTTVGAKATIITFAGANSGAQMHIEIWADSPAIIVDLAYTDTSDSAQRIPPSEWRMLGPVERVLPGAVAGLEATMGEIRPPILALSGDLGGKIDAVGASVAGLSAPIVERIDAVRGSVAALGDVGPRVDGLRSTVDALRDENVQLRRDVAGLRKQVRQLRKLIVSRLPARRRR